MSYSESRVHAIVLSILGVFCLILVCALVYILVIPRASSVERPNSHTVNTNTASIDSPIEKNMNQNSTPQKPVFSGSTFSLFSEDLTEGGLLPVQYTCDGTGTFPELSLFYVPKKAVSLAFVMHDPNVPEIIRADHLWYHLVAWNIPPTTISITTDLPAPTLYGTTTSGSTAFVPPCPPDAEHHYIFTLYALDTTLDLEEGSTAPELLEAMKGHILDSTALTTVYNRHE